MMNNRLHSLALALTAGLLVAVLLLQNHNVDTINQEHAQVVQQLQQTRLTNEKLTQELKDLLFERFHNFDYLISNQRLLQQQIQTLMTRTLAPYKNHIPSLGYTLNKLAASQDERAPLLNELTSKVVMMKNATLALSYAAEPHRLSSTDPELLRAVRNYQSSLLSLSLVKDSYFEQKTAEAQQLLKDLAQQQQDPRLIHQLQRLQQHGHIVRDTQGYIYTLVHRIVAIPVQTHIDQLHTSYLQFHEEEEAQASRNRIAVYLVTLLVLLCLIVRAHRATNAATAARRQQAIHDQSLGAVSEGVLATDQQGAIIYSNPQAKQLLGLEGADPLPPFADIFRLHIEATHHKIHDIAARALRSGEEVRPSQPVYLSLPKGKRLPVEVCALPIDLKDSNSGALVIFQDTNKRHQLEEQLSYQLTHDALTGFFNRGSLERALFERISQAGKGHHEHLVWHLDIDHFSIINDTCGTGAGDALLKQVADALRGTCESADIIARLGGDEFVVLRPDCDPRLALDVACQLREAINLIEFEWNGNLFEINVSIGALAFNTSAGEPSAILSATKAAVDHAREEGSNRIYIQSREIGTDRSQRQQEAAWIPRIRKALDEERFRLFLQSISPIRAGATGRPHHVEVLIRMEEDGNMIPPIFIPAAEHYHVMPKVDRWVVNEVLTRLSRDSQLLEADINFSINLSGTSISDSYFLDFIRQSFARTGVAPERICFEITETAAIQNIRAATYFMEAVRALGCSFALDDFGSGLSSFAYLQELPVDYLKIDGAFVKQMATNTTQYNIVQAMHHVAKAMEMQTIAEFVENDDIIRCLSEIGVTYAQGYGIDAPRAWDSYFDQWRVVLDQNLQPETDTLDVQRN